MARLGSRGLALDDWISTDFNPPGLIGRLPGTGDVRLEPIQMPFVLIGLAAGGQMRQLDCAIGIAFVDALQKSSGDAFEAVFRAAGGQGAGGNQGQGKRAEAAAGVGVHAVFSFGKA